MTLTARLGGHRKASPSFSPPTGPGLAASAASATAPDTANRCNFTESQGRAPQAHGDGKSHSSSQAASTASVCLDFFRDTPVATVIFDANLRVAQVSDSYLTVSGARNPTSRVARDVVLGCPAEPFFDQHVVVPPPSVACKALAAARDTGRPYQLKHAHADGTVWTIRVVPIVRHGTLQYLQMELNDVTDEHRKLLELEERLYTNETFRILVETVKDYAIFMLDPTGHIATWNAGAQRFKGYKKEEIIGKHFSSFYSQKDRDDDKPGRELADALRDGRVEDEGWRYRKDGSSFWCAALCCRYSSIVLTLPGQMWSLRPYTAVTR